MNGQNKEEETGNTRSEEEGRKEQCCRPKGVPEMVAKCCEGMGGDRSENTAGTITRCCEPMMKACRWFPLIPVMLAGAAFLLGYYLSPATVRVLWLVAAGSVVLMASLGLILAGALRRV